MDFTGKVCPYCKTEFQEGDDIVVCSVCEMPHHKECWIENKSCTTFGCTGTILGADQYAEAVDTKAFCSKCGTALKAGQKFCSACGTPAEATGEPHFQVAENTYPNQQFQQPQNNYTPQQQYTPYGQQQYNNGFNQHGQNQIQEMYNFIQSNQAFYIDKFQRMIASNSQASWNWCSFLFGGYWFAYRKMYAHAAIYAGIALFCQLLPEIGSLISIALSICAGIFGNYFYKEYVSKELQNVQRFDSYNKSAYIAKKGGTSIGAIFAAMGIIILASLIIYSI